MFAVPFLGPKNGPIFGAASYNSNKDGPIWRPQNWNPEIANIWPKLLIFWSRGLFLVPPFQATTLMCCLLLRSRCWSIFWGQLWRTMVSRASISSPTLASSRSKRQTLRLPMIYCQLQSCSQDCRGIKECGPEPSSWCSVLQLPDGKAC